MAVADSCFAQRRASQRRGQRRTDRQTQACCRSETHRPGDSVADSTSTDYVVYRVFVSLGSCLHHVCVCPCVYVCLCPFVCVPITLYVCQSLCMCAYHFVCVLITLYVWLLCAYHLVCVLITLYVCLSLCMRVYLFIPGRVSSQPNDVTADRQDIIALQRLATGFIS